MPYTDLTREAADKKTSRSIAGNNISGINKRTVAVQRQAVPITGLVVQRNPVKILGQTQKRLAFGRGNVFTDIKKTGGGSYSRTVGGMKLGAKRNVRGMIEDVIQKAPPLLQGRLKEVLPFVIMGAGNCMEHAVIAMFEAIEICPGETIRLMSWGEGDHQFLLVGGEHNIDEAVVVDPWEPDQNGKPYPKSKWYSNKNKMESPGIVKGDGNNYLQLAFDVIKDPKGLEKEGLQMGEKESKGMDFSDYGSFKADSPQFSIYNF
jgi:hypothetical protein